MIFPQSSPQSLKIEISCHFSKKSIPTTTSSKMLMYVMWLTLGKKESPSLLPKSQLPSLHVHHLIAQMFLSSLHLNQLWCQVPKHPLFRQPFVLLHYHLPFLMLHPTSLNHHSLHRTHQCLVVSLPPSPHQLLQQH